MFARLFFLIVILFGISASSLFAALMLPWNLTENLDNGFLAPKTGTKDVITPEGCRKISGVSVTKDYFVPTKTTTEWNAFKANIPTGITIGSCSIPTYSWSIGGSVDTDTCSSGQVRSVTCKRSDGQVVSQLYCNPATKPSTVVTWVSSIQRTTWAWWWSNGTFCANTIIWWNPAMMRNGSTVPQLFGPVSCANAGAYKPAAWQQADDLANYGTSVAFVQYAWHSLPSFPPPFDPWYTTGTSCYYIWTNHKCITYNCDPITPPPAVTGSCGSANNVNTLTAPVSNLCNAGSTSIVTASGSQWIWSCYGSNGGGNSNCSALNAPPPVYTYSWNTSAFGSCSVSCGPGTQTRNVTCRRSDNMTVADSYCTGAKPTASQSCNMGVCAPPPPPQASCPAGGPVEWDVWCSGSWPTTPSGSTYTVVDNTAPKTGSYTAQCNNGSWSKISSSCNSSPPPPQASCSAGGPLEWDVWCSGSWPTTPSGSTYTVVDTTAPKTGSYTAQCNNGSWSKISSSCSSSSINGVCGSFNGQTYVGPYAWADVLPAPGWLCSTGNPIQGSGWPNGPWNWSCQGSNGGSTVNCSASRSYAYSWNTSAYGSCSVSCGPGTQTRSVTCRRSDNMTVADSYCTGAKPTASQSCNMGVCPISCTLPWGGTIPNGASVTAYAYNEWYIYVQQCSYWSVKRTCINGTLNNPTHWWLGSPMIYGSCSTIGECPVWQVPLWCADSGGICGCTYLDSK